MTPSSARNGNEHHPRCGCTTSSLVRMSFAVLHYRKSDLLDILHPSQSHFDSRHVWCLFKRQLPLLWSTVSFSPWISSAATAVRFPQRFWSLGSFCCRSMVEREGFVSPTNGHAAPSTTDHGSKPSFHTPGPRHTKRWPHPAPATKTTSLS